MVRAVPVQCWRPLRLGTKPHTRRKAKIGQTNHTLDFAFSSNISEIRLGSCILNPAELWYIAANRPSHLPVKRPCHTQLYFDERFEFNETPSHSVSGVIMFLGVGSMVGIAG